MIVTPARRENEVDGRHTHDDRHPPEPQRSLLLLEPFFNTLSRLVLFLFSSFPAKSPQRDSVIIRHETEPPIESKEAEMATNTERLSLKPRCLILCFDGTG
jgi:hypothetical protein